MDRLNQRRIADALLVSGGMGYMTNLSNSGGGGSIVTNIIQVTGDHAIEIGEKSSRKQL